MNLKTTEIPVWNNKCENCFHNLNEICVNPDYSSVKEEEGQLIRISFSVVKTKNSLCFGVGFSKR